MYGSLLEAGNEFAVYLQQNSGIYAHGKFKGKLYDIGEYPGAIIDPNGELWVYGTILALNNPAIVLKNIDHYEGFGTGQPKPYLFIRKLIKVETDKGQVKCWVYLYNLPVNHLHHISSGNYLSYKNR